MTSKEDYDILGKRPPKKNPRSNGDFSVIDTHGAISDESDLSLCG